MAGQGRADADAHRPCRRRAARRGRPAAPRSSPTTRSASTTSTSRRAGGAASSSRTRPACSRDATAELTIALILSLLRRVTEGDRLIRRGEEWIWAPNLMLGRGLDGLTLGLVGHGRIGREVETLARAHGMDVVYSTRSGGLPLDDLLAAADVVSLHLPLTDESRHLIDAAALARMKPSAVLVNTSRGPIVDEEALVAALREGRLAGAALDVFEHEPEVHPGLLELENVVLVPHLGSATAGDARGDGDALRRGAAGGAARDEPATCPEAAKSSRSDSSSQARLRSRPVGASGRAACLELGARRRMQRRLARPGGPISCDADRQARRRSRRAAARPPGRPVTFATCVNGVKRPALAELLPRVVVHHRADLRRRLGERRRQHDVVVVPEGDDRPREPAQLARSRARSRPRSSVDADSISTRFIGSKSSAGLPFRAGITCQTCMKSPNSSSEPHGGVASSTEWPSSASSAAASSAAATHSGATGASIGGEVVSATRSRPGSRADLLGERPLGRRRPPRVAGLVAGHHVEQRGSVEHRPGQRAARREALEPAVRRRRDAAARGLDPEQPAARRRNADRAAAVAPVRGRRHARPRPPPPRRRSTRRASATCPTDSGTAPFSSDSVTAVIPSSGVFVLPSTTKPASLSRRTTAASKSGT